MINNRRTISGLLTVLLWGAWALEAPANGFRLGGQDAFATARGEAFVATADNASAVFYNPAGITQLEGLNFRGGISGLYYEPRFTPPRPGRTNTYHIKDSWAAVPQGFATYTPRDWPLSFGVGLYAPYGGSISWPQNTGFRSIATEASLTYATINPVVAFRPASWLSLGGGLMINYVDLEMEQGLRKLSPLLKDYFRFKGDGWSESYNLGVLFQPHRKLSLGATFRGAAPVKLEGNTDFLRQPNIKQGRRSAHMELDFPLTAVVGISYRPTPKWNLEFNADYTEWSSFGKTTLYQSPAPPYPISRNVDVNLYWQSSWIYSFGVTRYFEPGWHLSAGYAFSENSVPNAYYTPLAADLDRHFFSIGGGFRGKRYNFDLAYQFGYGPSHKVTGSKPSSQPALSSGERADGTYDFLSHAVMLTVGARF